MQGQEMVPAWRGLLPALRSGAQPWAEAHPAEAAAGRDFWGYLKVGLAFAPTNFALDVFKKSDRCSAVEEANLTGRGAGAACVLAGLAQPILEMCGLLAVAGVIANRQH